MVVNPGNITAEGHRCSISVDLFRTCHDSELHKEEEEEFIGVVLSSQSCGHNWVALANWAVSNEVGLVLGRSGEVQGWY